MIRPGLAILTLLVVGAAARACSVPVFRYALERWAPSPYDVVVFHRGPLNDADEESLRTLREVSSRTNVRIVEVDTGGTVEPAMQELWDQHGKNVRLPGLLLRYPDAGPEIPNVAAGPLSVETFRGWFKSPARRQVIERLTAGDAGVILLVLSGDAKADEAARAMLRRELPRIAARIELPAPTADGPQVQSELPLRLTFPVVEIDRSPAESALVRMLLGSEDGLDHVKGPIAFPVFGRGRALCSLHGADLAKSDGLRQSLEFLCRACSCQVKELNPGVDLLLSADWETIFDAERGPAPRDALPGIETRPPTAGGPPRAELRAAPDGDVETAAVTGKTATRATWLRYGAVVAGVLVLVTGAWAIRSRRPAAVRP
jgi:hypothetical protein